MNLTEKLQENRLNGILEELTKIYQSSKDENTKILIHRLILNQYPNSKIYEFENKVSK